MPLLGSEDRRVMRAALAKWGSRRQRSSIAGSRSGESAGAALLRRHRERRRRSSARAARGQSGLVYHWAAGCVDDHGCGFHHAQRLLVDQVIGWRGAFAFTHQRNVEADEVRAAQGFVQCGVANRSPLAADARSKRMSFIS